MENFTNEEGNSSECSDKKKTHLMYRVDFLSVLHQKFLAELGRECSFAQFCRLVPENIVKPKPSDWGTNLCMICIKPQLMLEGLRRAGSTDSRCKIYVSTKKKVCTSFMSKIGELEKTYLISSVQG